MYLLTLLLFTTIGTLKPSAQCKMGAEASGKIETVYVDVGDFVKKDAPLVTLSTSLLENDYAQRQSAFESAEIEVQDAQLNFNRMQILWNKDGGPSISQKRFEDAEMRLKQAQLKARQAGESLSRAQTLLNNATIKASFDGVITKRFVDPGEVVTQMPVTEIIEIQAIEPLYLEFSVSESQLNWIHAGTLLTFESPLGKETAVIDRVYPYVDELTRSVKCRAIIENAERQFRPGSLVKVELQQP